MTRRHPCTWPPPLLCASLPSKQYAPRPWRCCFARPLALGFQAVLEMCDELVHPMLTRPDGAAAGIRLTALLVLLLRRALNSSDRLAGAVDAVNMCFGMTTDVGFQIWQFSRGLGRCRAAARRGCRQCRACGGASSSRRPRGALSRSRSTRPAAPRARSRTRRPTSRARPRRRRAPRRARARPAIETTGSVVHEDGAP